MFDHLRASTPRETFRYERKFHVEDIDIEKIRSWIRLHPACFSEIYSGRFVNNIYFDTPTFASYDENVAGLSNRVKVRIRWYGDPDGPVAKPVLELKIKSNHGGAKASFRLVPFEVNGSLTVQALEGVLRRSELPDNVRFDLGSLRPVLYNRYYREYFLSADRLFRLTLDFGVGYRSFSRTVLRGIISPASTHSHIVELKYPTQHDDAAGRISAEFPFRNTKSSKYVSGMDYLLAHG